MAGKIRKIIIFGLVLCMTELFSVSALAAGEPQFRLDMDSLNLQKGVSSNLVVSLVNAQGAEVINIEGLENFDVLSQSQSTSTSIIGRDVTNQVDYYYTIMPKTTGEFTLKANIQYSSQSFETNTLEVTVGEGSANEGETRQDLFIKTILSQPEGYLGEKIVVTYELYSRYNIENFEFTDYTAIDGIIAKDMPEDQLKAEYVYLDGIRYAKYEAKQLLLDPIRAGIYTIPSFNLQVDVITDDGLGSIFGGGLGGIFNQSQPMYLQTEEKELTMKTLPSEGKPKDFSGIVGELQLDGHYSREAVNYGDSLSLQVTASGNCNLDSLKNIFNEELPEFAVYETQKNATESVENYQYHIQKEFEAILVPEKNGTIDIAPVSISYFNPVTEKYDRVEIPGTVIEVLGDMTQENSSGGSQAAVVETVMINQVNYTDASNGYFTIQMNKQVLYGILIGLILLLILGLVLAWLAKSRKKQDPVLKSLYRKLMDSKDKNEVYDLFNAIIKHSCNLSLKANSKNDVLSNLPDAQLAAQVAEVMDYMESHEEKGLSFLKDKIRSIYRMILS